MKSNDTIIRCHQIAATAEKIIQDLRGKNRPGDRRLRTFAKFIIGKADTEILLQGGCLPEITVSVKERRRIIAADVARREELKTRSQS